MDSSDRPVSPTKNFNFLKLFERDNGCLLLRWVLGSSILGSALLLNIVLSAPPVLAQDTNVSVPSLNKNKNIIYVNSQTGDDSQSGKKLTPFKTITQALKNADSGSTIKLASGTYSESTGETFPLIIKDQITLKGNTDNQGYTTIITGSGYFISPTGAGQNVAIAALKDAAGITGISVTNNHSRGHGLWIESASPKVYGNTFSRNGNTGVSVNGKSSPTIENNYFYNNSGNGLLVYGTSQPRVVDNTFEQTGFGVSAVQNAAPILTKNTFDGNRIGIILEGNSQATLRNNEIINSQQSGLTAIAKSRVDLGTTAEPGNNTFRSNKQLDIQNATDNQIVAVGTEATGEIVGSINFDQGEFAPSNTSTSQSTLARSPLPPLPDAEKPLAKLDLPPAKFTPPRPTIDTAANPALPTPPPVMEQTSGNKELVFTAANSGVSESVQTEPVPFPPSFSSSSTVATGPSVDIKYKVLVETLDEEEINEVRSLYPQAFLTVFEGQSLLQVGAFNSRDKAEQAEENLGELGLATYLLQ